MDHKSGLCGGAANKQALRIYPIVRIFWGDCKVAVQSSNSRELIEERLKERMIQGFKKSLNHE
ncbi:MAG: hypothetical protein AAFU03_11825, partial [Bacteroidota bacterium]